MSSHVSPGSFTGTSPVWLREPADANVLVGVLWPATAEKVDGVLHVGGLPVPDVVADVNTPAFLLDEEDFRARARAFRDGFAGYARHVAGIAKRFEHVRLDPRVWSEVRPASSLSPHLFLSAVLEWERTQLPAAVEREPLVFASVMWALRRGFFAEGLDISRREVQRQLAQPFGAGYEALRRLPVRERGAVEIGNRAALQIVGVDEIVVVP